MMKKDKILEPINYSFSGFFDNKVFSRFVKSTERTIRSDRSYLNYIKKVKEAEQNLGKDVILNNLKSSEVEIQMHHHPLTLYDLVSIVALHNFNNDIEFSSISLAKEVIQAHYDNRVGLAPMSVTTHELAHAAIEPKSKSRYINLTKKQIFGKYEEFVDRYKDGLTLDVREKLKEFENINSDATFKIDTKDLFK